MLPLRKKNELDILMAGSRISNLVPGKDISSGISLISNLVAAKIVRPSRQGLILKLLF